MKWIVKNILIAIVGFCFVVSCNSNSQGQGAHETNIEQAAHETNIEQAADFVLSETKLSLSGESHEKKISIKTKESWEIKEGASGGWYSVSNSMGTGDGSITIEVQHNNYGNGTRHGAIKINASNNKFYVIEIEQNEATPPQISTESISFLGEGDTKIIDVIEGEAILSCYGPEWVDISVENGKICLTTSKNYYYKKEGVIAIKADYKEIKEIPVTQEEFHFNESGMLGLSVEWATCNVGATSSSETGTFYTWNEAKEQEKNGWRLPTESEVKELLNLESTGVKRNTQEGIEYIAENDNYILIPKSGYKDKFENLRSDYMEMFWTSSMYYESYPLFYEHGSVDDENAGWYSDGITENCSMPVRLVRSKK